MTSSREMADSLLSTLSQGQRACSFERFCGRETFHYGSSPPQAFIDKFRFNAKRATMVQSRIKALNRLEDLGCACSPTARLALILIPM